MPFLQLKIRMSCSSFDIVYIVKRRLVQVCYVLSSNDQRIFNFQLFSRGFFCFVFLLHLAKPNWICICQKKDMVFHNMSKIENIAWRSDYKIIWDSF